MCGIRGVHQRRLERERRERLRLQREEEEQQRRAALASEEERAAASLLDLG